MASGFSIFVNTTDSFEDCWNPFFKLFTIYYPQYEGKIYLNTENKDYFYPGLDIVAVQNRNKITKDQWSNSLHLGLDKVDESVILYLQEDYFFRAEVNHEKLKEFASLIKNRNIAYVNLYPFSRYRYKGTSFNRDLMVLKKGQENTFNLQAALWDKKIIKKLVPKDKTPWESEKGTSFQTSRSSKDFLCLNPKKYNLKGLKRLEVIPYTIGVNRGKWRKGKLVKLFEESNIEVDFTKKF
jgi:hypothetical protein